MFVSWFFSPCGRCQNTWKVGTGRYCPFHSFHNFFFLRSWFIPVTVLGPGVTTVEKADPSLRQLWTCGPQHVNVPLGIPGREGTSLLQKLRGTFPKVNKLPPDFTYLWLKSNCTFKGFRILFRVITPKVGNKIKRNPGEVLRTQSFEIPWFLRKTPFSQVT